MKFFKVMLWIFAFPIMLMWVIFKSLIGLSNSMERSRKRRSRHAGVMCGAGGSRRR